MPRPAWPYTREQREDRDTTLELVKRVGRAQLRFSVSDVRKLLKREPHKSRLHHSADLHRHVKAMPVTLLRHVGKAYGISAGGGEGRGIHFYILAERWREYQPDAPTDLSDPERVHAALWIVYEVEGRHEVPTEAVTAAVRSVLELTISGGRQVNVALRQLADRSQPLARCIRFPGERWLRWAPVGEPPAHANFDDWRDTYLKARRGRAGVAGVGHATKSETLRELIERAIIVSRSPDWPEGRSVVIKDIHHAVATDARAAQLAHALRRSGSQLGALLGDVVKDTIVGHQRINRRIAKIENPFTGTSYYDLPDAPGFERRGLIVSVHGLSHLLSQQSLSALDTEFDYALKQRAVPRHPVIAAIAAMRLLHVQHELALLTENAEVLNRSAHLLSQAVRQRWMKEWDTFLTFRRARGTAAKALEEAERHLTPLGLLPAESLATDRPLLVGHDYAAWFPASTLNGLTPAEFVARIRFLRRFPNPLFRHRHDPDPRRAAPTALDRADALLYAAERCSAPVAPFLAAGYQLIGRLVRDASLPRLLLNCGDAGLERAALACLVLLGDPDAETAAHTLIMRSRNSTQSVTAGIHALLVLRVLSRDSLPAWLFTHPNAGLQHQLLRSLRAARQNRWLLQP
jgi:hypothetical protein